MLVERYPGKGSCWPHWRSRNDGCQSRYAAFFWQRTLFLDERQETFLGELTRGMSCPDIIPCAAVLNLFSSPCRDLAAQVEDESG